MANSRKDYLIAARIVQTHYVAGDSAERDLNQSTHAEAIQEAFVSFFRQTGESFDVERFREACKSLVKKGR